MRPKRTLRTTRPGPLALSAVMLVTPASAVALAAGQPDTQSAIQIHISKRHVPFGGNETVTGNASRSNSGRSVWLQFATARNSTWRTLRSIRVAGDGSFQFVVPLRESGELRVTPSSSSSGSLARAARSEQPSASKTVTVGSLLHVPTHSFNVLKDHSIKVGGRLLPAMHGRQVVLLGRRGRSWRTLASTRTGSHGGFDLRYRAGSLGHQWLRVHFAGDRLSTHSRSYAGQVTVYRESVASWYSDGGGTACGFHSYYGVANVSLPCGTHVRFRYGGRSVTAVVDDRGPYVGGREWDLNQNTASALGFSGVDNVWSST